MIEYRSFVPMNRTEKKSMNWNTPPFNSCEWGNIHRYAAGSIPPTGTGAGNFLLLEDASGSASERNL